MASANTPLLSDYDALLVKLNPLAKLEDNFKKFQSGQLTLELYKQAQKGVIFLLAFEQEISMKDVFARINNDKEHCFHDLFTEWKAKVASEPRLGNSTVYINLMQLQGQLNEMRAERTKNLKDRMAMIGARLCVVDHQLVQAEQQERKKKELHDAALRDFQLRECVQKIKEASGADLKEAIQAYVDKGGKYADLHSPDGESILPYGTFLSMKEHFESGVQLEEKAGCQVKR